MSFSIIGTGSALPKTVLTNHDLSTFLDTTDEWIKTRTGIEKRHICLEESVADIAAKAARLALESAGTTVDEIDLILCATISGDYATPSLACVVQKLLGATCPAFDINAACSGFVYALDVAAGYFERKRAKKVLVVAAEAMSRLVDWNDRSTCVIFGDGAGAAVLAEGNDLLSIKLTSKGDTDLLAAPGVSGNYPYQSKPSPAPYLSMSGQDVYRFAVSSVPADLTDVIAMAGVTEQDIDIVLLHQANIRIIDAACTRLSIPKEKFVRNIEHCGNTSAASVPILLDEISRAGKLKPGSLIAVSAFGGGLTTAACVLRWH